MFNFSNPVITIGNVLIFIFAITSGILLYRFADLYKFYSDSKYHNNKSRGFLNKHTDKSFEDFEPLFDRENMKKSKSFSSFTHEDYMNTVFEEYSKMFSEDIKDKREESNKIFQSKTEGFPEAYKILGFKTIPESEAEIKKRYRDLARKNHPDTGGSAALFIQINKAYDEALKIWKKDNNAV